MATALDRIIEYKRGEVAELKRRTTIDELLKASKSVPAPCGFERRLTEVAATGDAALICELKRKSPSAGDILPGADPIAIAQEYESAGAACLSILTDYPSFGGSLDDLRAIRDAVSIPLLRKEFMIDPIQVAEARAAGADAILVILSAVDDALAADLLAATAELDMDAIVEVHDENELARANTLDCSLVGINNRDLKRMVTDLSTTERLAPLLRDGKTLISESGISKPEHIRRLAKSGARRFLIGESLMKAQNRADTCENLRKSLDD